VVEGNGGHKSIVETNDRARTPDPDDLDGSQDEAGQDERQPADGASGSHPGSATSGEDGAADAWDAALTPPSVANGHAPSGAPDEDAERSQADEGFVRPAAASVSRGVGARPTLRRAYRQRRHFSQYLMRTARVRQAARARSLVRAAWATTVILGVVIAAVLTSTISAAAQYYQSQVGLIGSLNRKIVAQDSVRIFDSRGVLLYQFNDAGAQHSISLAHVPIVVVNATVATEDHDFWTNQGVDFAAIARAAYTDATNGQLQEGASTITQQLIKQNVLNSDPTFTRKIKEAILALGLTTQGTFTKRQILEMYLNSIPYGPTAYGIDAAATAYFGYTDDPKTGETAAQHLDLAQASMLAGIPQSPNYNDPLAGETGLSHARARQQIVLTNMVRQGYITQAEADAAWKEAGQAHFLRPLVDEQNLAPHFVYFVRQQLENMLSTGQLHNISRTGLDIYTTLDLDLQNHVQQYMISHLCGTDLNDYPGSPQRLIRDDNVTNAAAVMVDQHTGAIKVLLGSVDYYGKKNCHKGVDGKFDAATQGYRGPGSSFKPIVYATAYEKGWFPALTIGNEPTVFWDPGAGTVYKPLNADNNHLTPNMTLRNALQLSQNIPAVKTMQFAGVQDVERNAIRFGITDWQGTWGLSSALGTLGVHLKDMVQVYTVFANYGKYIPEYAIDRITDNAGDVLYQYQVPQGAEVLSQQVAFLITNVLSDNLARAPEFGHCSVLYLDPSKDDCFFFKGNSPNAWPAAAKTGTGQDLTDDWAMGYTMDYTMGVWVGNNDYSNMRWVDGVTGAAPIFYHSMLYAERNLPKRPFPVPPGVHQAKYTSNGITTTDWFVDGPTPPGNIGNTAPGSACIVYHDSVTDPWDYCSGGGGGGSGGGTGGGGTGRRRGHG
jgi:membrane peptidoglycan carboxypeptidase